VIDPGKHIVLDPGKYVNNIEVHGEFRVQNKAKVLKLEDFVDRV